jgi:hypothetical protein
MSTIDYTLGGKYWLVPANPGSSVRVVALVLTAQGDVAVTFSSEGASDEPIAGPFYLTNGIPLVLPWMSNGWFESRRDDGLSVTISADVAVGGHYLYGVT